MAGFDFFLGVQTRSIRLAYPEVFAFICQFWDLNTCLCAPGEATGQEV